MKKILLWIWQLPQHLLALILWAVLHISKKILKVELVDGKQFITIDVPGFGISLGYYVFLDQFYEEIDWYHECGHGVQSRRSGPLYLLVIGITSAVFNNLWDRLFHKKWTIRKRLRWYYNRFPEKQADRLGGIVWKNNVRIYRGNV